MRFAVSHLTSYTYTRDVHLEPQLLRLKPRSDATQRLLSYDLSVLPQPAGCSELIDVGGDSATLLWFFDATSSLQIATSTVVETLRPNPFDYLWLGSRSLPLAYDCALESALLPYRVAPLDEPVTRLGERIAASIAGDAQLFPGALALTLSHELQRIIRPDGDPLPPAETLARGAGSCRDLTQLFVAVCRAWGFASRFVSGYHALDLDEHELHAWAEVYLPGGGWRGFDPSTGLAVADRHIALASAAEPRHAAPVSGTYRGRGLASLQTAVSITPC